ncbi:hypothetical protein ACFE04_014897 [Oxalis oulophora]
MTERERDRRGGGAWGVSFRYGRAYRIFDACDKKKKKKVTDWCEEVFLHSFQSVKIQWKQYLSSQSQGFEFLMEGSSLPSSSMDESSSSSTAFASSSHIREEETYRTNDFGGQQFPFRNAEIEHHHHNHHHHHDHQQLPIGVSYVRTGFQTYDASRPVFRDDAWSCIIVVLTFWFFVSMTLILGVYGAVSLRLGPHSSILIEPNPLFVESVKVEELDDMKPRPTLFGFYKTPPLNDVAHWSEIRNVSINSNAHMEWIHYLNPGSQINISYTVKSPGSSVFLVVAEGNEGLARWLEDPTYPNITLSWNVVHGSGMIQLDIQRSSSYYIAVGNLNSDLVKVELNINMMAKLYNTNGAYKECSVLDGTCRLSVLFPKGNSIVLVTPRLEQGTTGWYVKVSYGPRWLTYIIGVGSMTAIMLVAFNLLNKFQRNREVDTGAQNGQMGSERAPLISYKDDDLSSLGSSYDSMNDDKDLEEFMGAEGKAKDGENNTRRLCAICFDAPRDCFFLPCGHCVACFGCGKRISEADGTCPICRRNIKKVRKIFTV